MDSRNVFRSCQFSITVLLQTQTGRECECGCASLHLYSLTSTSESSFSLCLFWIDVFFYHDSHRGSMFFFTPMGHRPPDASPHRCPSISSSESYSRHRKTSRNAFWPKPVFNVFLTLWTHKQAIKQTIYGYWTLLYEKDNISHLTRSLLKRLKRVVVIHLHTHPHPHPHTLTLTLTLTLTPHPHPQDMKRCRMTRRTFLWHIRSIWEVTQWAALANSKLYFYRRMRPSFD